MFWELAPEDVIGKPAELQCAEIEREWKRRKHKMEKASRGPWTENEGSPRALQLREYTLRECWEIFVDDRPIGADAMFRHVDVQSKAVCSYAMTMMDKINGREDEERWVGSKFASCMWIYTKEELTRGQRLNLEQQECLKKRIMSILLCTNWVCAGTFVDHERVSSRTICQQEEEILSMALDLKVDVPCVLQWSLLWFSAPTRLNKIWGHELKTKKYHEVVNSAIMDAFVRPFGGEHTPRSCMLTSVARVLHSTHREGWMIGGSIAPHPLMVMMTKMKPVMNDC